MNPYLKGFLSLFNWKVRKPMSDNEAIASDWQAVSNDMRNAIKIVMADDIGNSLNQKIERKMAKRGNKRGRRIR